MQPLEAPIRNIVYRRATSGLRIVFIIASALVLQAVCNAQEKIASTTGAALTTDGRTGQLSQNTSLARAESASNKTDGLRANTNGAASANSGVKETREAKDEKEKQPTPGTDKKEKDESSAAEVNQLKLQLADQQKQLDELRQELKDQKKLFARTTGASVPLGPPAGTVASEGTAPVDGSAPAAASPAAIGVQKSETQEPSPLSFRIGSTSITPVGFMDFTTVFRSTNPGSGLGTNFGSVPFANVPQGRLTELRMTAQNSRFGVRLDSTVKDAKVLGYFEADFLGVLPANPAVTSNSYTNRLRLYFVDVRKDKFEILAGQSWSLLTPNRKGLSPIPGDIFYTQNVDTNYQAGMFWARQAQVRFVYHPTERLAFGVSLENPEQYIGGSGGGGTIVFPTALNAGISPQLDNGNSGLAVPNLHPDIIAKIAFDPKIGKRDLHLEFGGLFRSFKVFNPINSQTSTTSGGGFSANLNAEFVKNVRFITNNFYSDGGGRYIFGLAPDLIVKGDGTLSAIHSMSTVTGIEALVTKNTLIYSYYGGVYIRRNTAIDPANGRFVGYGFPGSATGQNRSIQEGTVGFTQTFWRDPKYGALQLMGQYSYLTRRPWAVPVVAPFDAHSNIFYLNIRYLLPGSAPKPK